MIPSTVTENLQMPTFPDKSVAVTVTNVTPNENTVNLSAVVVTFVIEIRELSVITGSSHNSPICAVSVPGVDSRYRFVGQRICGGSVSF